MLQASGMSQTLIARRAGVSQAVISYLTTGRSKTCQVEKARRILAVQPRQFDGNAERPALGFTRRIRALYSLGHSRVYISQLSGLSKSSITQLAEGRWNTIDNLAATTLDSLYHQLALTRGTSWRNERRAAAEGWAPPGAWDDIDDPNAMPDWTGHCGTNHGYWLHRHQQIAVCTRCQTAHDEWVAEHAHLDGRERTRLHQAARTAASSREADLATDARELIRVSGLDYQQAADRLGVTRQHIQQVLVRHPEDTEVAA
jgi:predicted DNA-binding protein (UPF0251 family)